jgi:tetratricopeptide (TPR) repeat protein
MKKLILLMIMLTTSITMMAQETQDAEQPKRTVRDTYDYQKNLAIYSRALKYNDQAAAKNALYSLIALEPQNDSLLFSLSYMYFENQNYISAILTSKDLLALNSNNEAALEIAAISYENIGVRDKALESYESLYLKNEDLGALYKIAFLQYQMKRYNEARTSSEIILDKEDAKDMKLYFTTSDNQQQEIPVTASVHNLLGMINQAQDKKEAAREQFNKALAIAPEFELAKNNLTELDK